MPEQRSIPYSSVLWTAFKILLIGAATVVLSVVLAIGCGTAIPLVGGPPGVAIAGVVFCRAWGSAVGGSALASRCRIAGLLSLSVAAVLIIAVQFVAGQRLGDEWAFALAMSIGGTVVGAALGAASGGKSTTVVSTIVGLLAWFLMSLLSVSPQRSGTGAGPLVFFALMYTPALGLTAWGTVMGIWLSSLRPTNSNESALSVGDAETSNSER